MKANWKSTNQIEKQIGNIQFIFRSDIIDNKEMDTEVFIENGDTLCWISGPEKEQFIIEFTALIEKYRI